MNRIQTNVLGIACEPGTADPNEAALRAVSKCERIALPGRLGPPDPLETLRVIQGNPSREQFVRSTLAPVVKSEAGNPELQRRAAQAVVSYCERHGVTVPTDVRKSASNPVAQSASAKPTPNVTRKTPHPCGPALARQTDSVRRQIAEQNAQIAELKRRLDAILRRSR